MFKNTLTRKQPEIYITESIVRAGEVLIPTGASEMKQEVLAYNERMCDNQQKIRQLENICYSYFTLNMGMTWAGLMFGLLITKVTLITGLILLAHHIFHFLWFYKTQYIYLFLNLITTAGLMLLHKDYFMLNLIINIALSAWYLFIDIPLRQELDYPRFHSLRIVYPPRKSDNPYHSNFN